MQIVERGRLRLHDGVELGLEVQLASDVLEQKEQSAHRVALARNGQGAIIRQGPSVFLHPVNIEIVGEFLSAPFGIIRAGRQLAALAQAIQQLPVVRAVQQEALIEIPHVAEGLVVEGQFPVGTKDGDGVGDMVQRLVMRTDMAVQFLAGILLRGHIERHRPCPTGQRESQHTHRAALTIHHHVARLVYIGALGNRLASLVCGGLVQHQLAVQHTVEVHAVDGLNIGRVHPLQLAHAGHAPGGERRLAQHVEESRGIAGDDLTGFFQLAAGRAFFQTLDGRVCDPDDGASASCAAIGLQEAAGGPNNGQRKRLPRIAQFAQADAQRCVLSGTVTRFQISKALNDPHRRIGRDRIICKAEQTGQRDGRTIKFGRRHLFTVGFQRIALPDQDHAGMGPENRAMLRQQGFEIGRPVLVFTGGPTGTIGNTQRPQQGREAQRRCTGRHDDRDLVRRDCHSVFNPNRTNRSPVGGRNWLTDCSLCVKAALTRG